MADRRLHHGIAPLRPVRTGVDHGLTQSTADGGTIAAAVRDLRDRRAVTVFPAGTGLGMVSGTDLPPGVAGSPTARRDRGRDARERLVLADHRLAEDLQQRLIGHLLTVSADIQAALQRVDPDVTGRLVAISAELECAIGEIRAATFDRVPIHIREATAAPAHARRARPPSRPAVPTEVPADAPPDRRSPVGLWRALRAWWRALDDLDPLTPRSGIARAPYAAGTPAGASQEPKPVRGLGHTLWF